MVASTRTTNIDTGGLTLSHDSVPITILLVDDDPDCRLLIRDAIAESKVSNQVFEAADGAEALGSAVFTCDKGKLVLPSPALAASSSERKATCGRDET